jgi:methionyl-tRNA formyltransferase
MPAPLRIVFLGSDPIALPVLHWLAGEGSSVGEVVGVFTQPDRPAGRGQKVQPNAIKAWALARGLPIFQPEKLTPESRDQLAALQPDDFIATSRLGTVNLHTSLLPKYRGASPIQTAIANGETETGVSLMRIVRRLDAGPVADVERVSIGYRETAADLESKLAVASQALVARALPALAAGALHFAEQDDAAATTCRRLTKADGALDFKASAATLAARINGLFPWPGCTAEIGGQPIKLGLVDQIVAPDSGAGPGMIMGTDDKGLLVATGQGVLRLLRLQRPGGKMLPAPEFLRGFPIPPGILIPSRPMPVLVGRV